MRKWYTPPMEKSDRQQKLGRRLKEERERLGMTQAAMASAIGVGRLTGIHYELGDTTPTADVLMRLREVGVDVVYVLTGDRPNELFDISAMEQAVELMLDLVIKLEAQPDKHVMTQALLHFYRSILSQHSKLGSAPIAASTVEVD